MFIESQKSRIQTSDIAETGFVFKFVIRKEQLGGEKVKRVLTGSLIILCRVECGD